MGRYFGTDGIRGPVDGPHINPGFVKQVGQGYARYLKSTCSEPYLVVIGRDPRPSGEWMAAMLADAMTEAGFQVMDTGMVPTPVVAKAVHEKNAAGGIVLTASHNPASDNGIKLFARGGTKYTATEEATIEDLIEAARVEDSMSRSLSRDLTNPGFLDLYCDALVGMFKPTLLNGLRLGLDTANGATRVTSPRVFQALGADLFHLGDDPDGSRINQACGSEHPEELKAAVQSNNLHLGLAHDGDGDRLVCVDETGHRVDGDQLMGMIALDGIRQGWMNKQTLVTTIQSNMGLDAAIQQAGGTVLRVGIGDRNVAEKMRETGASFGGENSGHLIFGNDATTGDGLLAALRILEIIQQDERPFSERLSEIPLYPQRTQSLRVSEKRPIESCEALLEALASWNSRLEGKGRLLVRYSGTEAKLRLLAEADSADLADSALDALVTASQKDLEVLG